MLRSAQRFLSLPGAEQRAYVTAAWWLLVIRLMFKTMSFAQITRFIARRAVRRVSPPPLELPRLAAIVQNAGARIPSTCLSRSLAGALVLARFGYPSEVLIGVSTDQDFQAHAWLESEGTPITEKDPAAAQWNQLTRVTVGS